MTLNDLLIGSITPVLGYFLLLNSVYIVLYIIAFVEISGPRQRGLRGSRLFTPNTPQSRL